MVVLGLVLLTLFSAVLALVYQAELDRRRGKRVVRPSYYYRTFNPFLSVYNNYLARHSRDTTAFPNKTREFPGCTKVEAQWEVIRDEALNAYHAGHASAIRNDMFFTNIVKTDKWKRFYIKWYTDTVDPATQLQCPHTAKLVQSMPEVKLAMFSIMEPGTVVSEHRGPFRGAWRYHLGLDVPEEDDKCYIVVDDKRYGWRNGEGVLFDDTFLHRVENRSDRVRIILFMDIERQLDSKTATRINRWFCKHVAPLTARGNDKLEATHSSKVAEEGKKMKNE